MKKPCWIFRLLNKIDYSIKHLWKHTKSSRDYVKEYTKDLIFAIIVGLVYITSKTIQHFYMIISSIVVLILTTIVAFLIGAPLGQIVLSHSTMKTALGNPNLSISFLPILKVIGVGFIGIAGCILVAFSVCEFSKYVLAYLKKNMVAARLWDRHEKHIAND